MTASVGSGRRIAVGASAALMVAVQVGVPAYVSSVGSEALAIQLEQSCLTDLGVRTSTWDPEQLNARADDLTAVSEPVVSREASLAFTLDDGLTRSFHLVYRPGQLEHVDATAVPGPGEVLVPDWATTSGELLPGTVIAATRSSGRGRVDDDSTQPTDLLVVGTYETIPTRPEPAFWCSYRDQLRFSSFGDPPPPFLLTPPETFERLSRMAWSDVWEVSPDPANLRRDQARASQSGLQELQVELEEASPYARLPKEVELATPIRRADQVADFVSLTIAPLRYAGALVALVLLVGSAVMVARAQRRELQLRALRGVGTSGLAVAQLRWLLPTTLIGGGVGALLGWLAVRQLGPNPNVEPASLRTGLLWGALGWVVTMLLAAVVIGVVGARMVDRTRRRVRLDVRIVGELAIVGLAGWSFQRLDTYGGVRQIGVEVRGGDLLAQAFPFLGAMALVVVVNRPLLFALRHARRFGRRLPMPLLLGFRRVTFEPVATAAVMLATTLAVAVAFEASALTSSVDRLLHDKAATFVGSDLSIAVLGSPPSIEGLGAAATEVVRSPSDDRTARFLGIDPTTFADAVVWRDDAADRSLDELMTLLAADPTAAIAVDPEHRVDPGPFVVGLRGSPLELDVVATADFFPGYSNGSPLLIVGRDVVDDRGDRSIIVRDPVAGATDVLIANGGVVTATTPAAEVFDGTNFLSAQWSYATLTAFAALLALVTLVGQVLVLEARLRARRVMHVIARPMGMTRRQEFVAGLVEVGAPLVVGVGAGSTIGWVVARLGLGRLDSLRNMQPPAVLVVDPTSIVVAAAVVMVATLLLATVGTLRAERTDPAEVMRVAES